MRKATLQVNISIINNQAFNDVSRIFTSFHSLDEKDKDLNTTIQVLKHEFPNQLPLGENITMICKTKWISSIMMWFFNEENVAEMDG